MSRNPNPHLTRLGAISLPDSRTQFRLWAPDTKRVVLELVSRDADGESVLGKQELQSGDAGIHSGVFEIPTGSLYRYSLDGRPGLPDPRSRFQPLGVHGPSQVIDSDFTWSDDSWRGIPAQDLVIYELHVGAFSASGDYQGVIDRLDELTDLGVNAIELLPLAQTPGRWNWGYDGVNYYAPRQTYGAPADLKRLIDRCHAESIAVIHDVVYNHVGPEGNYLANFGPYKSAHHNTPWGDALNFDGLDSHEVREFVIENILYWIDEFHFDGVRLDAVHYLFDDSDYPILDEIRDRVRSHAATLDREILLIGESNIYDHHLVGDLPAGQPHHDAIWSDCLMHSIYAVGVPELRLTNRHYQPTDLAEALEHGYVFAAPQAVRADTELRQTHHPAGRRDYLGSLIMALQTHDSVGNHPHGSRLHQLTSLEFQAAAAPLILLYPSIPMIFMGEELAADATFPFFADFEDERLRAAVDRGRREEYPHHQWQGSPLPSDPRAFHDAQVPPAADAPMRRWYRDLLTLRKSGRAEGWLAIENLSTESDAETHQFSLAYAHPQGRLRVVACLAPAGSAPLTPPATGASLLLDSRQVSSPDVSPVSQAPQCLIWLEE